MREKGFYIAEREAEEIGFLLHWCTYRKKRICSFLLCWAVTWLLLGGHFKRKENRA